MSASLTVRRCVSSESPIASSSKCLRNGWTSPSLSVAPRTYSPVTAVSIVGEPCTAARCRKCLTARMPPSSSPPPARPGPPCLSIGSGEPWPGRLGRGDAVEDEQPAVPRRHLRDRLRRDLGIVGDEGRDQAAAAARGERHRLVEVFVRHQRRHRTERLDVVDRVVLRAVAAQHQRRREEGAVGDALALRREAVAGAEHDLVALGEQREALADVGLLRLRGERAHLDAFDRRIADADLGEAIAQPRRHRVEVPARHDRAPDRGALLAGLDRHLARHFLGEQVELLVVRARRRGRGWRR